MTFQFPRKLVILTGLSRLAAVAWVLASLGPAAALHGQTIKGPSIANVSQEIRLVVDDLDTPELADAPAWAAKLRLEVSAPDQAQWLADPELTIGLGSGGLKLRIYFAAENPGVYVLIFLDGNTSALAHHRITVGGVGPTPPGPQPDPTPPGPGPNPNPGPNPSPITQVTYVYEKSNHAIPMPVASEFNRLNRIGVLATIFEQDSVDSTGATPKQYAAALAVAKQVGLPCVVSQKGAVVHKAKLAPKTVADVQEVLQ